MRSSTVNSKTWVEIKGDALGANVRAVRSTLAKKTGLMAVVKANAYGHGIGETVPLFEKSGVDFFGVDSLEEARPVRKLSKLPVLILGYTPLGAFKRLSGKNFHQTIYTETALDSIAALGKDARIPLHLKIETGTARQGVAIEDLPAFLRYWKKFPYLDLAGVSTHFSDVEDVGWRNGKPDISPYARLQLERFRKALEILKLLGFSPRYRHAASSAATLFFPETHFDLVRPGIALYGLWPSPRAERAGKLLGMALEPALSWKTVIAQVKTIAHGESIGYDRAEIAKRDTRLAVLPIGYWDGYPRHASQTGVVLVREKRAKILGRVCMNMMMIDVTDIPNAGEGDETVLIGRRGNETMSAEELAQKAGTIHYEIVTRINPLIPRAVR